MNSLQVNFEWHVIERQPMLRHIDPLTSSAPMPAFPGTCLEFDAFQVEYVEFAHRLSVIARPPGNRE